VSSFEVTRAALVCVERRVSAHAAEATAAASSELVLS
jgi:hypothetical protein